MTEKGLILLLESPPSRGAWIEIVIFQTNHTNMPKSPPSRGAWIEIP